jgi:3-oxoacyl-[acyl-carrier-protein] synthase III
MGLIIERSASAVQQKHAGAIDSAASVAEACIRSSGLDRAVIDVLINTGIYKDSNRIEPAFAAFIQRKLDINADPLKDGFGHTTFSFDLSNGRNCFLHAVQIVDSLARTGTVRNALVVSSSAASVEASAAPHSRSRVATAALLRLSGKEERGFHDLTFYCDDDAEPVISGHCDPGAYGPGATEHVTIEADGRPPELVEQFVLAKVSDYLRELKIDPARISLMLSSYQHREFARRVTAATGIRSPLPVDAGALDDNTFGSGLMVAWDAAREANLLTQGTTILMIEGGPGPIAALALYNC